jgi:hypothetical protein
MKKAALVAILLVTMALPALAEDNGNSNSNSNSNGGYYVFNPVTFNNMATFTLPNAVTIQAFDAANAVRYNMQVNTPLNLQLPNLPPESPYLNNAAGGQGSFNSLQTSDYLNQLNQLANNTVGAANQAPEPSVVTPTQQITAASEPIIHGGGVPLPETPSIQESSSSNQDVSQEATVIPNSNYPYQQ